MSSCAAAAGPITIRASVAAAAAELVRTGVTQRIMIDASHANSGKNPENQPLVVTDVAGQISGGEERIVGVMIESNLVAGRQDVVPGKAADLWAEHHRRLHRLANHRAGAEPAGRRGRGETGSATPPIPGAVGLAGSIVSGVCRLQHPAAG